MFEAAEQAGESSHDKGVQRSHQPASGSVPFDVEAYAGEVPGQGILI